MSISKPIFIDLPIPCREPEPAGTSERECVLAACWKEAEWLERQWAKAAPAARYGGDDWSAGWIEMNELAGIDRQSLNR